MKPFRELMPAKPSTASDRSDSVPEGLETAASGSSRSSGSLSVPPNARKRPQTRIACEQCRRKKSKCDGTRPVCASCAQAGLSVCDYDGDPDLTRTAALKKKNEELQHRIFLFEELFRLLAQRSENEFTELLRRMRTTNLENDLEHLVRFIKDGDMLVQLAAAAAVVSPDDGEHGLAQSQSISAKSTHEGGPGEPAQELTAVLAQLKTSVARLDTPARAKYLGALQSHINELADVVTQDLETPPN